MNSTATFISLRSTGGISPGRLPPPLLCPPGTVLLAGRLVRWAACFLAALALLAAPVASAASVAVGAGTPLAPTWQELQDGYVVELAPQGNAGEFRVAVLPSSARKSRSAAAVLTAVLEKHVPNMAVITARPRVPAGLYSGYVVVYAHPSGAVIGRSPITFTVPARAEAQAKPPTEWNVTNITAPYIPFFHPQSCSRSASSDASFCFSDSVIPLDGAFVRANPQYWSAGERLGILTGSRGGSVAVSGHRVTAMPNGQRGLALAFGPLDRPGLYTGTVALTTTEDVKVNLIVREGALVPLSLIVLGAVFGLVVRLGTNRNKERIRAHGARVPYLTVVGNLLLLVASVLSGGLAWLATQNFFSLGYGGSFDHISALLYGCGAQTILDSFQNFFRSAALAGGSS